MSWSAPTSAAGTAPVALVTGASAGTGQALSLALAAAGYAVAVLARREAALAELVDAIGAGGGRGLALVCDVGDPDAVSGALDRFLDWSGGRIDVLVNAAGQPGPVAVPIGEVPLAEFERLWTVNLRAPFLFMSRLLPVMYRQGCGRVVNIGGNHAMRGRAGRSPYSASKWGLRGLTRTAALEAGSHGVTVNFVAPGPIAIERMKRNWRDRAEREGRTEAAVLADYMRDMGAALGRPSEAEDVVATVMFLLGPGGRNITGQDLVVDGGIIV
ncbi:SDR family oxidoreductase [Acetobacteraceae bacterium KSS8]|uniref:SDR family oxidoreductase n=1 Tax=Endosaccharibacter trunci TaxID=2812733 RepID=A0ABT1WB36_9PROT|nr:SDR family oxidoreductase [Acetobacteraceae bacterium KSS8]